MRERIIGAIAVVVVAIIVIPWLIAQVHAPRTIVRAPSPSPAVGSAVAPDANDTLYDLPPVNPAERASAPVPASAAPPTTSGKSIFDLPSLAPAKSAPSASVRQPPVAAASTASPARTGSKPRLPASGWAVQAASFSDRKSAQTLAARLTRAGIRVFFAPHAVGGTLYYRVMAGPYPSATAARAAVAHIGAVSGTKAIVRRLGGPGG